jgi:hypothetical protein
MLLPKDLYCGVASSRLRSCGGIHVQVDESWGKSPSTHVNPRELATLYTQLRLVGTDVAVGNSRVLS